MEGEREGGKEEWREGRSEGRESLSVHLENYHLSQEILVQSHWEV